MDKSDDAGCSLAACSVLLAGWLPLKQDRQQSVHSLVGASGVQDGSCVYYQWWPKSV